MVESKTDLIRAIGKNTQDLHQQIKMHRDLVASFLKGQLGDADTESLLQSCPLRSREETLEEAIRDAIEVLEASRRAFKSKQLETLRKKLTRILIGP